MTKSCAKACGKGKLAIRDGNVDEEETEEKSEAAQIADVVRKDKDARVVGISNMEEAIQATTKRGRMTAQSRRDHEMLVKDGSVWVEKLKLLVSRKGEGKTLVEIKEQLAKAAGKVKDMKDEAKELQQTAKSANKAMSKASTRM